MNRLFAPINEYHEIIGTIAFVAIGLFSMLKGPAPQRVAGLILLLDGFGLALVSVFFEQVPLAVAGDLKAILVLVAYAVMTLRWPHRWIMLLTALQALAVLLHLARWGDLTLPPTATSLLFNLTGWAMLLTLLAATAIDTPSHRARGRV